MQDASGIGLKKELRRLLLCGALKLIKLKAIREGDRWYAKARSAPV